MKRIIIFLLLFHVFVLCGKDILMVVAPDNFRDEEYKIPYDSFIKNNFTVDIASTTIDTIKGMLGMKIKPDLLLKNVKPDEYKALVLVGGIGTMKLRHNKYLIDIIKCFKADTNKLIGAICLSPIHLIDAGIMDSMDIAMFVTKTVKQTAKKHGINLHNKGLICYKKIVTAAGPKWASEYAESLIIRLK